VSAPVVAVEVEVLTVVVVGTVVVTSVLLASPTA